jgi:hypothetical protein
MDAASAGFQALLFVHFIGLAMGLGGAFIADYSFMKTLRRADRISPETVVWMRSFSVVVWLGLGLLTLSGAGMFLTDPSTYLHSGAFLAKMLFVLILIINGLFLNFYTTARLTTFNFSQRYPKRDAAWKARKLSFVFGAVSGVTWYSTLLIAVFRQFLDQPFLTYVGAFAAVLMAGIAGSLMLERLLFNRVKPVSAPLDYSKMTIAELERYSAQAIKSAG